MNATNDADGAVAWLKRTAKNVNEALDEATSGDRDVHPGLREAMRYSALDGGKRFRPALVLLSCEACGGDPGEAMPAALAIEMVHCFSLVHDDLPGMDDDDLRRGRPTNHKAFGEAMAILAGDGLLALAFETVARGLRDPKQIGRIVLELADATGWRGMIAGQADDIRGPADEVNEVWVHRIHLRKTARLVMASTRMGAIVADADEAVLADVTRYGETLGLAFQIADDLLDIQGDEALMGKGVRKDADGDKITYPGVVGVEAARQTANQLADQAVRIAANYGDPGKIMAGLARFVVDRRQ